MRLTAFKEIVYLGKKRSTIKVNSFSSFAECDIRYLFCLLSGELIDN